MKIKSKHVNLKWATCLMLCLPYAATQGAAQYSVTDLGNLGGTYNQGLGVNNSGLATGFSHLPDNVSEHAFFGQATALPQDLGTLGGSGSQAFGINNLGAVVGSAETVDNFKHAFSWQATDPATPLKDLKGLVDPGFSLALAVNDKGQAAGYASTVDGAEHAVVWQLDTGAIADLDIDNVGNSRGLAINALGQVAGSTSVTATLADTKVIKASHASLWNADKTKLDLGTLGGNNSVATAINAAGQATGSATTALEAESHAFLWQATQVPQMKDLGTLGGKSSEGRGISAAGDVVGKSTRLNDTDAHAFLWQAALGMQDLNTLIDPLSGWVLYEANAISEDGTYISGMGLFNGKHQAFLLKREVVDTTAPQVSFVVAPAAPSASGWYVASPSVTWTVNDPESAVTKTGCTDAVPVADTSAAGQTFTCTAKSAGGTTGPISTDAIKVDTVKPALAGLSAALTAAATSSTGAVVTYITPTATDAGSGAGAVSCLPASGANFPLGPTTVNCSVSDNAGNSNSASFVITVADQTPPVFAGVPADITQAATNRAGVVVNYTLPTATDTVSGVNAASLSCVPASGSTFALGLTRVNCAVSDNAGNSASASFDVTVEDQTPPVFVNTPAAINAVAIGSTGAVVAYTLPTATDAISGVNPASLSCSPASGSTFALGATTVNCSVSDNAGNTSNVSFVVNVTAAPVVDVTAPIFTACRATVALTQGQALAQPAVDDLTAVITRSPAGTLPLGTTPVIWTATDAAGNSGTCNQQVTVTAAPVTETITVSRAQCRRAGTTGEWTVQGTSSLATNHSIQLYTTATVPQDLTTNRLATVNATRGAWSFQSRNGSACTTSISLQSPVTGAVVSGATVSVR